MEQTISETGHTNMFDNNDMNNNQCSYQCNNNYYNNNTYDCARYIPIQTEDFVPAYYNTTPITVPLYTDCYGNVPSSMDNFKRFNELIYRPDPPFDTEIFINGFYDRTPKLDNIYYEVCDTNNLVDAFWDAAKNRTSREEVQRVMSNLPYYIGNIYDSLNNFNYHTSTYNEFDRMESRKVRHICSLPFYPDRIVHTAIVNSLKSYLMENIFIDETFSAIKGRGPHRCIDYIYDEYYKNPKKMLYYMQLDIHHYYESINHDLLKKCLSNMITDKRMLWLLDEIIDSYNPGIPIGNHTSQYFGNIYLNELDRVIKYVNGDGVYLRYMDDLLLFNESKEALNQILEQYILPTTERMGLTIKPNIVCKRFDEGLDFVGYIMTPTTRICRDYLTDRMIKAGVYIIDHNIEELTVNDFSSFYSYWGWISKSDDAMLHNDMHSKVNQKRLEFKLMMGEC